MTSSPIMFAVVCLLLVATASAFRPMKTVSSATSRSQLRMAAPAKKSVYDAITTPVLAGTLAVTAISFQIFGIFPWHEMLSEGFETVEVSEI